MIHITYIANYRCDLACTENNIRFEVLCAQCDIFVVRQETVSSLYTYSFRAVLTIYFTQTDTEFRFVQFKVEVVWSSSDTAQQTTTAFRINLYMEDPLATRLVAKIGI